jgi:hypothetical protein
MIFKGEDAKPPGLRPKERIRRPGVRARWKGF